MWRQKIITRSITRFVLSVTYCKGILKRSKKILGKLYWCDEKCGRIIEGSEISEFSNDFKP
jgi:hypothetical protein